MLNIGFIIPSGKNNFDPFRNQPLVAPYLLTIVEKKFGSKVNLSIIDLRGINENSIQYHIPENDIFLYSVATPDFNEILNIVKILRSVYQKSKHIAGGPHINIFPEETSKVFDSIVLGEGEESIINVINDILSLEQKSIYRQESKIDLNAYPYPSRKYMPKTTIVSTGLLDDEYLNLKGTTVIFSRGCVFNCHFCANKNLSFGPLRYRSPRLVEEEIEYLKKEYQIEALALKDDNAIPLDLNIAKPLLEAIGRTNVKWRGQSRANGVHPDMVRLAKEAGCTDVAIGIESVSPKVLRLVNKKIDLAKAKDYINKLHETGIGVRLHFIIGLPGEEEDIVKQTLNFIDETKPQSVLLSIFCPAPGSKIYESPEEFGIKLDTSVNWENYRTAFGRFDANEFPSMVFEYKDVTPWGKGISKERILKNCIELQTILRERKLNF
ncbi:MAG: radical SAM protein [Candidatus Omnitrophota bacterium]|nr:radical SAM protein [Candidatus Omnitrophota bacterium]